MEFLGQLRLLLVLGLISACSRETAEISPEALHAYGLPSQKSNVETQGIEKKDGDKDVSWIDSSAVVEKKTVN